MFIINEAFAADYCESILSLQSSCNMY